MDNKKFYTLMLGMFTFGHGVMAQTQLQPKTVKLNAMMQAVAGEQVAYRMQLTPLDDDKYNGVVYDGMDNLKIEGQYIERNAKYIEDGYFKYFFPNGSVESEGEYQSGVKIGYWKRFDFQGNRKTDRYYPPSSASMRRKSMNIDISTDN
jgi:hypothetical protein